MGHPQVRESVPLMTHNGGIPAQLQGHREGQKPATTKFDGMWNFTLTAFLPESLRRHNHEIINESMG
jgi:hypothetical protein